MKRIRYAQVAAWTLAAFMVGCEPGGELPRDRDAETVRPVSLAPAQLAPIDHSGVTGTVIADRIDAELVLTVALEGLTPEATYSAHLHDGRCAEAGLVRLPLGRFPAREDGTASIRLRATDRDLRTDQVASVQIRGTTGPALACANLLPES